MSTFHSHIVTRGSMKIAHNLDDRQERAVLHTSDDNPQSVEAKCVSQAKATRIHSNIDQLRAALKAAGR